MSKKDNQWKSAAKTLPPITDADVAKLPVREAARASDGRSARATGREKGFNTKVTPEFHRWLKQEALACECGIAQLLERMQQSYIKEHGKR